MFEGSLPKINRMSFENRKKNIYLSLFIPFIIFILDRTSKIYVINLSKNSLDSELFSSKFLNIILVWNEGIAFGLFSFDERNLYNFLTLIILIMIFVIFIMIIRSIGPKKNFLLMVLGGATGNLYDRVFYKAVPDFIDIHFENLHWFVFNVADIFITLGVILLILWETLMTKKNYEKI